MFFKRWRAFVSSAKANPRCFSNSIWSVKDVSCLGYGIFVIAIKIKSLPWARCSYGKRGKHVDAKIKQIFLSAKFLFFLTAYSFIIKFSFLSIPFVVAVLFSALRSQEIVLFGKGNRWFLFRSMPVFCLWNLGKIFLSGYWAYFSLLPMADSYCHLSMQNNDFRGAK